MRRRSFIKHCGGCLLHCAALRAGFGLLSPRDALAAPELRKGFIGKKLSPYFRPVADNAVVCTLCPNECAIGAGKRGACQVRENQDGKLYSLVYGNPCAVNVDPIEKKPFFHVLPRTSSFSIATAGCNFHCKFCQNWEISQARPEETMNYELPPEDVARFADKYGARSVASTYVEPTIFLEYMYDVGLRARERKLLNTMHSNGYVNPGPLNELCGVLDAACIDLKGFEESYYREVADGRLQPVLDSLKLLKKRGVHTELVTLVVPGKNDDIPTLGAMAAWIVKELGPDVPLHFTRFYPKYVFKTLPPTPVETLERAREAALAAGLRYVYLGNVPGHAAESTICPKCKTVLIARRGYESQVEGLDLQKGACRACGTKIPGIWS
jgi:pyruvate formate lyase activating enzyme